MAAKAGALESPLLQTLIAKYTVRLFIYQASKWSCESKRIKNGPRGTNESSTRVKLRPTCAEQEQNHSVVRCQV